MTRTTSRRAASRKLGHSSFTYFDVMKEAEKPQRMRKHRPIGRGGDERQARRFHVKQEEIAAHRAAYRAGDDFPNPHSFGWYRLIIESLKALGLDQRHPWEEFRAKAVELMSGESTKDAEGHTLMQRLDSGDDMAALNLRLLQNVEVLQRLNGMSPYGWRINQVAQEVLNRRGGCIDLEVWKGELFIRLNLQPETVRVQLGGGSVARVPVPINETRRLRQTDEDQRDLSAEVL